MKSLRSLSFPPDSLRRAFRAGCAILILSFLVSGQAASGLTLAEALTLAEHHPAFREAEVGRRQAVARARDAGTRGPDSLALEVENVGLDLPGFERSETTLSFSRSLRDRAKVDAARRLAGSEIRRAAFEEERLRWQVTSSVQAVFHAALAQQELLAVVKEGEEVARRFLEIAGERVSAGAAPESEILKAELGLNLAEKERLLLEKDASLAKCQLAREIGVASLPDDFLVGTLTWDIPLPSYDRLQSDLAARHPDLQALTLDEEESRAKLARLRAETRPGVAATAGLRDLREERDRGQVFGVTFDLPNRRASAGECEATGLEMERIGAGRDKRTRELRMALQEAFQRCQASREIARRLKDHILPASTRLLELSLESYQLGKADQLLALEAQKTLIENRRDYILALADLYDALNLIERLCGVCLVNEHH